MSATALKRSFELESTIESFYTGGTTQISADGEEIYCACGDIINVVSLSTGKRIHQYKDDGSDISCFVVSPDQTLLISACKSFLHHQFALSTKTFSRRWKFAHKTQVLSMTFDPTSTLLATGSSDMTIKIYDVIKMYYTHNFKGSTDTISALKFHPNPEKLVLFSASTDGMIRIWDLGSSKCVSVLKGHYSSVTALELVEDQHKLISAGRDKVIIYWDLNSRKQIRTVPVFEAIESLVIVPKEKTHLKDSTTVKDNEFVITAGEKGQLRAWSLSTGACLYMTPEQDPSKSSCILYLHFNSIKNELISVNVNHNVIVHSATNLKPMLKYIGYFDEILDLKFFGEDQNSIAIATNSNNVIVMQRGILSAHILQGHTDIVLSIDVSHDGKYIASTSKDNTLRVWCFNDETNQFCVVAVGSGHTHAVSAVAWPSLSTDYLVTGSKDLTLKCWKLPNLLIRSESVNLTVKWTDKAHDKDINVACVSPNDKIIVTGSQDKTAKLWKLRSGKLLGTLRGHRRGIWCARFSPVDQCVATGSTDSTIRLWALSDFSCVKTFEGHSNSVLRVEFLHKGMQLISSGSEGLIKVWNIQSNECITTIEGHEEKIWCLTVDRHEEVAITGGADSTIKMWKDVTEKLLLEDEEKANLQIQREQELANLVQDEKYDAAIGLAIKLEQPFRVLNIFKEMLMDNDHQVKRVVSDLNDNQLNVLLKFICDWNTNAKHATVSQCVLSAVLRTKSPDELMEFPNIKDTIEALLPYTERHYARINDLAQQSMFVTYASESMKLSSC